jgi:hypothetical protein
VLCLRLLGVLESGGYGDVDVRIMLRAAFAPTKLVHGHCDVRRQAHILAHRRLPVHRSLRDVLVDAPTEAHCAATGRIKSTVTLRYPVEFGGAALARRGVVGGGEGMHAENATVTSGDGVKASHQAVLPRKNLQHA